MDILRFIATSTLLLLIVTFAQAQKLPTKSEHYEFLKWYIANTNRYTICDTLALFPGNLFSREVLRSNEIDFTISMADRRYFEQQLLANKLIKVFDKSILSGLSCDFIKYRIQRISLPLFSIDKKLVLIFSSNYNSGGHEIYIKVKGRWQLSRLDPPRMEY